MTEAEATTVSPHAQANPADCVDCGDIGRDKPPDVADDRPSRPGAQLFVDERPQPGGV